MNGSRLGYELHRTVAGENGAAGKGNPPSSSAAPARLKVAFDSAWTGG